NIEIPRSWVGLKFSADERFLYAAGGNDNWILKYAVHDGKLERIDSIPLGKKWPHRVWPAGIEIDDGRQLLYVVTRGDKKLYLVDLKTKTIIRAFPLKEKAYACVLAPDR